MTEKSGFKSELKLIYQSVQKQTAIWNFKLYQMFWQHRATVADQLSLKMKFQRCNSHRFHRIFLPLEQS